VIREKKSQTALWRRAIIKEGLETNDKVSKAMKVDVITKRMWVEDLVFSVQKSERDNEITAKKMKQPHEEIKKNQEHGNSRSQVKKVFQGKESESTVSNTVNLTK